MEQNKLALSVVLPAYKECDNLAVLIPQIEEEFKDTIFEIIVVDDNSKDGTRELLAELEAKYHNIVLVERAGLLGLGGALRDGYNKAQGEYILSSDSDMSFYPPDMRALFNKIRTGFDMVLGYYDAYVPTEEEKKERGAMDGLVTVLISKTCNAIIRTLSGIPLKNYNTNFRIIKRSVWQSITTKENRQFFLFETIIRAKQKKAKITEMHVTFHARKFGESKLNFMGQAPAYFMKLLKYVLFDRAK
jgi:glycosyltransferase involved in cell wall biosynthesis